MIRIPSADTLAVITGATVIREAVSASFVVPIIARAAYALVAHRVKRALAVRQYPTRPNDHSNAGTC